MIRRLEGSRGFTLIEVTVALVIGALVIVLAHGLLTSVTDAAARGLAYAAATDRAANQRRWLVRTFAGAVVDSRFGWGFDGTNGTDAGVERDRMTFTSIVRVATGTAERRVTIGATASGSLIAELRAPRAASEDVPDTLILATDLRGFGAEYLPNYGANTAWVMNWVSPASAPVAARLRLTQADGRVDTLVLHIGARG